MPVFQENGHFSVLRLKNTTENNGTIRDLTKRIQSVIRSLRVCRFADRCALCFLHLRKRYRNNSRPLKNGTSPDYKNKRCILSENKILFSNNVQNRKFFFWYLEQCQKQSEAKDLFFVLKLHSMLGFPLFELSIKNCLPLSSPPPQFGFVIIISHSRKKVKDDLISQTALFGCSVLFILCFGFDL